MLTQTASAEQRSLFEESNLDDVVLGDEQERQRRRRGRGAIRSSLEAYLPIRAGGLVLSATDMEIYRACPLRYKFARVYSVPKEQTLQQRFGILMHQVLERYHTQLANQEALTGGEAVREPTPDTSCRCSRRGGGARGSASRTRSASCARRRSLAGALPPAVRREEASPVVRAQRSLPDRPAPAARARRPRGPPAGRVLRADRLQDRTRADASQLKDDIQLSLYQIGAKESWKLESSHQSYYYLLDDEKVPLEPTEEDVIRIRTRRPRSRPRSSRRSST